MFDPIKRMLAPWRGIIFCFAFLCSAGLLVSVSAATLIEGPSIEVTSSTTAVIRWSTDVATGGRARYGTTLSSLSNTVSDQVRRDHIVSLKGLQPATKYFFSVGTARFTLATNSFRTSGTLNAKVDAEPKLNPDNPVAAPRAPPAHKTWGNIATLQDHFDRHGADFKAKDQNDYARQAWEYLQRARAENLPTKVDDEGVIRIFDPRTRAFAAYNRDGTTKTYFKPNSRDYFERQAGRSVSAKTLKF